jgi:hypothetical protein
MTGDINPTQAYSSRWAERDARRRASAELARDAAIRRIARKPEKSLVERVSEWQQKLDSANVATTLQLAEGASSADRDIVILAEKYGQGRATVLRQLGAPRGSVETAYLAEVGLANPEQTP